MKRQLTPLYHKLGDFLSQLSRQQKKIIILGLRRSGNHAVINWILHQQSGLVRFFNNLQRLEKIESAYGRETRMDYRSLRGFINALSTHTVCHSYEEVWLAELNALSRQTTYKKNVFFLLVLRDPFNFFASRYGYGIKSGDRSPFYLDSVYRKQVVELWKEHARFFLQINKEKGSWIGINYNEWVTSLAFRKNLATTLGLHFTDKGFKEVTTYGLGSSFGDKDLYTSDNSAKVLNRWHQFAEEKAFKEIFDDEEIWILAKEIFGNMNECNKSLKV